MTDFPLRLPNFKHQQTEWERHRDDDALDLLKHIVQEVEASDDATEVMALVKIGPNYHRFSTGVKDMVTMVGMLELAKVDCIQRMTED